MNDITFPLEQGEQLLWSGAPRQGMLLQASDVLLIPLSLFALGFSVYWEKGVLSQGAPWGFALLGVPFVLFGIYITVGRFFYDARRRSHTTYALTTHRVIMATTGQFGNVVSLPLETLTDIRLVERSHRDGSIMFTQPGSERDWPAHRWTGILNMGRFEMIPDAPDVYRALREARAARMP